MFLVNADFPVDCGTEESIEGGATVALPPNARVNQANKRVIESSPARSGICFLNEVKVCALQVRRGEPRDRTVSVGLPTASHFVSTGRHQTPTQVKEYSHAGIVAALREQARFAALSDN